MTRDKITENIILIFVFIFFIITIVAMGIKTVVAEKETEEHFDNLYPLTTIVEEIHEANNLVTVRDFNGNLWQFYLDESGEDWEVGDICSIIFDNKGTEEIKDDEIVAVRYSGWMEGWK